MLTANARIIILVPSNLKKKPYGKKARPYENKYSLAEGNWNMRYRGRHILVFSILWFICLASAGCNAGEARLPIGLLTDNGEGAYLLRLQDGRLFESKEDCRWFPIHINYDQPIAVCEYRGTTYVYETSSDSCVYISNRDSTLRPAALLFSASMSIPPVSKETTSEIFIKLHKDNDDIIRMDESDVDLLWDGLEDASQHEFVSKAGIPNEIVDIGSIILINEPDTGLDTSYKLLLSKEKQLFAVVQDQAESHMFCCIEIKPDKSIYRIILSEFFNGM